MNQGKHFLKPILFLIFNRPDATKKVFDVIKKIEPPKLYIAADGPRSYNEKDAENCASARSVVDQVDWDCRIHTLFRENNLGCKCAVSSVITWFFEHEEDGIILEDDWPAASDIFQVLRGVASEVFR